MITESVQGIDNPIELIGVYCIALRNVGTELT